MKKIITLALAAVGVAFISTACINTETNRIGDQVPVDITPVQVTPQVEIGAQKISGTATVHSVLGIINWGVSDQAVGVDFGVGGAALTLPIPISIPSGDTVAKNGAVYNACVPNKADILVAPQYFLKTKNYFVYKVITCDVTGYPGTIKSVKLAK